jgi:DNA-binding HxlR family transcriptional regulator
MGDRWSVLLVQEAFFGVHEFDAFQQRLAIAPNILSDRLSRFCERGILEKRPPSVGRRRGYFLTEKGLELYPVAAMLRQWAIEIRGIEEPLAYSHRWCGARLALALSCTRCGEEANSSSIEARVPEHVSRITVLSH